MKRIRYKIIWIIIGIPAMCFVFPIWIITGFFSYNELANLLIKTGQDMLSKKIEP